MTTTELIQRETTYSPEIEPAAVELGYTPYYDERLSRGVKVVVMGPPHSGKSVFIDALSREIDPELDMTMIGGCPDGEGLWLQRHYDNPEVAKLRRKGAFTPEFVEHARRSVEEFNGPLALIDIGGRVSDENREIAAGATHAVILAGDLGRVSEWQDFADELGIPVIAKLHSHYAGNGDVVHTATDKRVVASTHYLERGTGGKERESVTAVADMLGAMTRGNVAYWQSAAERKTSADTVEVTRAELLGALGRDGVLSADDIAGLYRLYEGEVSGKTCRFTGFDRGRELVALCFAALENGAVKVEDNSMRTGAIEITRIEQEGEGLQDERFEYTVTELDDGSVLVDVRLGDIIESDDMQTMRMPEVSDRKVVISGRIPHWLRASMAVSYAETCPAVAIFTPGEGNMTVWSHNRDEIGEVTYGN